MRGMRRDQEKIIKEVTENGYVEIPLQNITRNDSDIIETLERIKIINIDHLRNGLRIKFQNVIGIIEFDKQRINITPKFRVTRTEILTWIDVVHGTNLLKQLKRMATYHFSPETPLTNFFALSFLELLKPILKKGIFHDYVDKSDNFHGIKGKIMIKEQIMKNHYRNDIIYCKYDVLSTNILENQLITTGILLLLNMVKDPLVKNKLLLQYTVFQTLAKPVKSSLLMKIQREDKLEPEHLLTYNRLNHHYKEIHKLIFTLIRFTSIPDPFIQGRIKGISFLLIPTWRLFELLIQKVLECFQDELDFVVKPQHQFMQTHCDEKKTIHDLSSRIDFILKLETEGKNTLFPIEVKYKDYDNNGMNLNDLYQAFYYSMILASERRTPQVIIIYPSISREIKIQNCKIINQDKKEISNVVLFPINISLVVQKLYNQTTSLLNQDSRYNEPRNKEIEDYWEEMKLKLKQLITY